MDKELKMVPALCTQCGGTVEVNTNEETATCPFCGMTFMIEKAVNNYNVKYATIEHADNVNIDVSGAVKDVLDFVGDQMKESREERKEFRKESAERQKTMDKAFIKIFGFMFAGMLIFALIAFIILQFTGDSETENETGTVSVTMESDGTADDTDPFFDDDFLDSDY
jgi:predicted RNA-binding Zn-ribbon protein involved in translation (DUF1610 family)